MIQQNPPKKLLDQLRETLQALHYAIRTENTCVDWVKRFILFRHKRHPKDMGVQEVTAFLSRLATERKVAASTHIVLAVGARGTRPSAPSFFYTSRS